LFIEIYSIHNDENKHPGQQQLDFTSKAKLQQHDFQLIRKPHQGESHVDPNLASSLLPEND
jgi:hypothetical protein